MDATMHDSDDLCGLFGGAFDPIHHGHLAPVKEAFHAAALSEVIYIPSAAPPHRPPPEACARHRLEMARIAVADVPHFRADDLELRRPGPSYSMDTLQALRRQNPRRRYALIVGLDALLKLETWHCWAALRQHAHIIGIRRRGWRLPQPLPRWWQAALTESSAELRGARGGKLIMLETAPVEISATAVRARIHAGEDASHWVPPGVWNYIHAHHLYQHSPA